MGKEGQRRQRARTPQPDVDLTLFVAEYLERVHNVVITNDMDREKFVKEFFSTHSKQSDEIIKALLTSIEQGFVKNSTTPVSNISRVVNQIEQYEQSKAELQLPSETKDSNSTDSLSVNSASQGASQKSKPLLPPRVGERMLLLVLSKDERVNIPGDLEEEFSEIAVKHGEQFAKVWYYKQVATSAWPMIRKALRWGGLASVGEWIRRMI
jgi:hypothetical protein